LVIVVDIMQIIKHNKQIDWIYGSYQSNLEFRCDYVQSNSKIVIISSYLEMDVINTHNIVQQVRR